MSVGRQRESRTRALAGEATTLLVSVHVGTSADQVAGESSSFSTNADGFTTVVVLEPTTGSFQTTALPTISATTVTLRDDASITVFSTVSASSPTSAQSGRQVSTLPVSIVVPIICVVTLIACVAVAYGCRMRQRRRSDRLFINSDSGRGDGGRHDDPFRDPMHRVSYASSASQSTDQRTSANLPEDDEHNSDQPRLSDNTGQVPLGGSLTLSHMVSSWTGVTTTTNDDAASHEKVATITTLPLYSSRPSSQPHDLADNHSQHSTYSTLAPSYHSRDRVRNRSGHGH
ncbi:hypothetical protein OF83DRAFT_691610 [Amylostereum chailletii]|nr:hypothetical protein OF83DRAFT_691610 [Amylostereum chailletii]